MDTDERFQYWMTLLNQKFQAYLDVSLIDIIYDPYKSMSDKFDTIRYTHPALFMVQYSMAKTLIDYGIIPDYLFGISLGEIVSFAVGHALELEEAVELVVMQANVIEANCREGGMLTVLVDTKTINGILKHNSNCCLVSSTADQHQIISGYCTDIEILSEELKEARILFQKNAVIYGFHSHAIDFAKREYMNRIPLQKSINSKIPVISAYSGCLINQIDYEYLWEVIREGMDISNPILWLNENYVCNFIDVGPSGSMVNLARLILGNNEKGRRFPIMTPFGNSKTNYDKLYEARL